MGGKTMRRADLTTVGPGSWPVPPNVYSIIMDGSGGGGGGGAGSSLGGGGGGGGSAEWTSQIMLPVVPGEILTYAIGAGGAPGINGGVTNLTGSLFGTLILLHGLSGVSAAGTNGANAGANWGGYVGSPAGGAGAGANSARSAVETATTIPVCYASNAIRSCVTAAPGGAKTFNGGATQGKFHGESNIAGGIGNANGGGGGNGGEGPFGFAGQGGNAQNPGGNATGYGAGGGGGGGDTLTPANQLGGSGSPGFLRFYYWG